MYKNKRMLVHRTFCIAGLSEGDIITVDEDVGKLRGKILTVNGLPYKGRDTSWAWCPPGLNTWEIIGDIELNYEIF